MRKYIQPIIAVATITVFCLPVAASALTATAGTTNTTSTTKNKAATLSTADQQLLTTIQTKGNQEIARRLTSLATLSSKINATTKLTASDKTALSSEVSSEITGLTTLKTTLDAETTAAGARTDAQSIYNDYRVYALVVPKVWLAKTADDQQVAQGKLTALATKLQARLTQDQQAGKNVASLQSTLADLNAKVTAAQAIASGIETGVIGLQPSDYDSNHSVLSGDAAQLKTASTDDQAAITDAQTIITGLKNL